MVLPFLIFSLIVAGNGYVHAEGEIPPEGVPGIVPPAEPDPARVDRAPAVVDAPTDSPSGENADLYES